MSDKVKTVSIAPQVASESVITGAAEDSPGSMLSAAICNRA